jgi:hypothetical protein
VRPVIRAACPSMPRHHGTIAPVRPGMPWCAPAPGHFLLARRPPPQPSPTEPPSAIRHPTTRSIDHGIRPAPPASFSTVAIDHPSQLNASPPSLSTPV